MLNSTVLNHSSNDSTNHATPRFDPPQKDKAEELRVYLEMVSSYMAIYPEYADQVAVHAESYFKERFGS